MSKPDPNFEPVQDKAYLERVKRRRYLSRSDEEIASDIDCGTPYRQGWPQLPPLPVSEVREGTSALVGDKQAVYDHVRLLCALHRFDLRRIYFAFRAPEVRQEDNSYLTLVITGDLATSDNTGIFRLIIEISKFLLEDPQRPKTLVEIIDDAAVYGLKSLPILHSEKHLLSVWQSVFDTVLVGLHKHNVSWLTIEMLHRGLVYDVAKCPATVVITSPSAADWHSDVLSDIHRSILELSPSLEIELLCGSSLFLASKVVSPGKRSYEDYVPIGSSIGPQDIKNHSATAGGMVKLSNGTTYALTNHHVIRNEQIDSLLAKMSAQSTEQSFLRPGHPAFDSNKISCPSNEDNKTFIEEKESNKKMWLSQTKNPMAPQQLASTEAELAIAVTKDRSFGRVYASSGTRTVKSTRFPTNPADGNPLAKTSKSQFQHLLDWSLIQFQPGRGMFNRLPEVHQHNVNPKSTIPSGHECSNWTVMNNPKCNILCDDVNVGKFGRTTAFTYGLISDVPVIINPHIDNGVFKSISETYGLTTEDCGYSMSCVNHPDENNIVNPGDSGSILLHAPSGDWLGLIFGQTHTSCALFIPIDIVFRDIERVTGYKVVEPVFNCN